MLTGQQVEYAREAPTALLDRDYALTPEKVAAMVHQYESLSLIEGDSASYKTVRGALTTIVHTRTGVDKRRKELNEEARNRIRQVDSAAKQLLGPLAPLEERLRKELRYEDARKAAVKAAIEAVEKKRVEEIREKISDIQFVIVHLPSKTLQELRSAYSRVNSINVITGFDEFEAEARSARESTLSAIAMATGALEIQEKQDAARREEDARIETIRQQQAAERKWLNAARLVLEEKDREVQQRQQAQEAAEREKYAEEAKREAEKAAMEEHERRERDRLIAHEMEQARLEKLRPVKERLCAYADALMAVEPPDMGGEAEYIIEIAVESIGAVAAEIRTQADRL